MRLWIEATLVAVGLIVVSTLLDISLAAAISGAVFGSAYYFTRLYKPRHKD